MWEDGQLQGGLVSISGEQEALAMQALIMKIGKDYGSKGRERFRCLLSLDSINKPSMP